MVTDRFRAILIAVCIATISISGSSAHADLKPTPTPKTILSPSAQYEENLEKVKIDMKEYQRARALREQQLRAILKEFNRALRKASEEARLLGKSAVSKATLAAARAAAATERDEAVALLGPEPVAPTPPPKPMKSAKVSKEMQKPGKKN